MEDSVSVDQSLISIWHHQMNRSPRQITMGDSVSFDQGHHSSSASLDRGYVWILHHWVRMGKSPLLKLADLGFEGSEPWSETQ
ncbi:hypothetical protein V6N13_065843 [Hibiscus sabdariffa]